MIPYNYAEEDVFIFIKSQCKKDETVVFMPYNVLTDKIGRGVVPDMYLPNGCSKLAIKPKTCIEVKSNLLYDTLDRIRSMYDFIKANLPDEGIHLMLVTMEPVEVISKTGYELVDREVEIKYFGDWIKGVGTQVIQKDIIYDDVLLENMKSVRKAFVSGPNTFFLGAGISRSEGLPDWNGLLFSIMRKVTGRKITENDFNSILKANGDSSIIMGRYIRSLYGSNNTIEDDIHQILYKNREVGNIQSKTIVTICDIIKNNRDKVRSVVTYNYDDLIEQQLSNIGIDAASIFDTHEPDSRFPVYHVHGILDHKRMKSSRIVLSEDDYHEQYRRPFLWSNVEQLHALQNHNCFFIGLSMMDPNLRRLLDFTKSEANSRGQRDHHCFAFLCKSSIVANINGDRNKFLDEQKCILENLGVRVIWYDNHDRLPAILEKLYKP